MNIDLSEFSAPCGCGKEHPVLLRDILLEPGALKKLPQLFEREPYRGFLHPVVLCDENTYLVAGREVLRLLPNAYGVILNPSGLHADERAVEEAEGKFPTETDLLLAVGSGSIHDITRYCAHKRGIPFFSVPTAASVDGFVSTVAAMTWHEFKKTMPAVSPICVIADTEVFAKAPQRLTASGVSDLLGKFTALADWSIAHIVTGEYLCERVCQLELRAVREVCGQLEAIHRGETEACEKLMYALLLSGIAMQMVGNSRPASGAEHHFSHLWEIEAISPHINAYHGEKVSVGLLIAASVYHRAGEQLAAGNYRFKPYTGLELELLQKEIRSKAILDEILLENADDPLLHVHPEELAGKIPRILAVLSELPTEQELRRLLDLAGCKTTLAEIGLEESIREPSILISPYMRKRLTFLRLLKLFEFMA